MLRYLEMGDEQRDYTPVLGTLRNDFRGNCVYCSHCQPCPVGIDIAAVNKYLDIAQLDEKNIPLHPLALCFALRPGQRLHRLRKLRRPLPVRRACHKEHGQSRRAFRIRKHKKAAPKRCFLIA